MDVTFSNPDTTRFGISYSGDTQVVSESGNEGIVEGIRVKFPSHRDEEVIVAVLPRSHPSFILLTPWSWNHVSLSIIKSFRGRPADESIRSPKIEENLTLMKTMQLFLRVKHSDRPALTLYPIHCEIAHLKAKASYDLHVTLSEEGTAATLTEISEEEEKTRLEADAEKILAITKKGYAVALSDHIMGLSRRIDVLLDSGEPIEALRALVKGKISGAMRAFGELHAFHPASLPPLDPDLDTQDLAFLKTECDTLHVHLLDGLEVRKTQPKVSQRHLDISYDARSYPELERLFRLFAALIRKIDA